IIMSRKCQNVEERYFELLYWFDSHKKSSMVSYYFFQVVVILFSTITPVVILIDLGEGYKWLEGLLPAVAALAAGIQSLFKFNETWVSRAEASERLKSEFVYFKSRIGVLYDDTIHVDKAAENFLNRIEEINRLERNVWVTLQEKSRSDKEN
ncbi:DUF4231 domain-containing protein, partial [Vibrio vulnificus]|nr:DUF4231 domain-containing protein [Vibrio vulnificus]